MSCVLCPVSCVLCAMAARMLLSPPPRRFREPDQCSSAEKERPSKQRSLREFGVLQGPASCSMDSPASSVEDPPTSSVQASKTNKYKTRGTCGTFAGRRPPKSEDKLKQFLQDREEHQQKLHQTPKKRKTRQSTDAQCNYRDFVKAMLPYEVGGNGQDRLTRVATKWKKQTMPEKLAQENKSVL